MLAGATQIMVRWFWNSSDVWLNIFSWRQVV
jgi:hypothetical protein